MGDGELLSESGGKLLGMVLLLKWVDLQLHLEMTGLVLFSNSD